MASVSRSREPGCGQRWRMKPLDKPMLFVATANAEKSRTFYERVLGLEFVADEPYALVFQVGRSMLRIQKVDKVPRIPFTLLGWEVADIRGVVRRLSADGVTFARYEGLGQDGDGIWLSPGGARVAWFQDPDGNTLSLTQFK